MNKELKKIIQAFSSKNLTVRKQAMEVSMEWSDEIALEDALILFKKAANIHSISGEHWDDPSYAFVKVAGVFLSEEMIPVIEKYIDNYSYEATSLCMSYLLIMKSEQSLAAYKRIFTRCHLKMVIIPTHFEETIYEEKESILTVLDAMIENDVSQHPWYMPFYHHLLSIAVQSKIVEVNDSYIDRDYILKQFHELMEDYKAYDEVYSREFVYEGWQRNYLLKRNCIRGYLIIQASYWSNEELISYQKILYWKDPYIQLTYLALLWERKINASVEIALEVLQGKEGTPFAFQILNYYKKELLPTPTEIQKAFVLESAAFTFLQHEEGVRTFPDETEVMDSFNYKDFTYGDDLRYYVVRFKSSHLPYEDKGWMRMMIGPYLQYEIPTPNHVIDIDANFTDFVPWHAKSTGEHVADFIQWLKEQYDIKQQEEPVYGTYKPAFNRVHLSISIIVFLCSIYLITFLDSDWIGLCLFIAPLYLLFVICHSFILKRNVLIQLREHSLEYEHFGTATYVQLAHIESVALIKIKPLMKDRLLFLPCKRWHFVFFDFQGNMFYQIPRGYINEAYFLATFEDLVRKYSRPASFRWEEEEEH